MAQHVFVIGLDAFNREQLKTVRGAQNYAFHGLIPYDEIVNPDYYPIQKFLDDAKAELSRHGDNVDAVIGHWDFPTTARRPWPAEPAGAIRRAPGTPPGPGRGGRIMSEGRLSYATLGGGCFWCVEAVLQRLEGVRSVTSGYAGGHTEDPDYRSVCTGRTGHAEVVQVAFDPDIISYRSLLEVFFTAHDPTQKNRQGNDVGTQYRSIILYHDEHQREAADRAIRDLAESGVFGAPIVTEVEPLDRFYPAEGYHQDFFDNNPGQPYCQVIIGPKLEKVRQAFGERMS